MGPYRGRFAPSPSGALHLGSVRTAWAARLAARASDARFVLRVEDLDAARTAPGATEALLSTLRWLGIGWDEGPDVGGPYGPYLQSERRKLYDAAFSLLRAAHLIFPCSCSRREVDLASQAPHGAEPVYPGTCRGRDPEAVIADATARHRDVAWRFAVEPGTTVFVDAIAGERTQDVSRAVGDFVVFRADRVAAYQLAVVVDDALQEITDVVRGDDLIDSTARQILLYRALGAQPPRFCHVPLVVGDDGVRLAKRHGGISIDALRDRGVSAERINAALLASLGCERDPSKAVFDPAHVPKSPVSLAMLRGDIPEIG